MAPGSDPFDDLPDPLEADLARLYRAEVRPSPAVDQAILSRARAHAAGRKRALLLRRVAGAAAAAVLVAAALIPAVHHTRDPARPAVAQHAHDVTGDGVVDIRDALALRRSIDAGGANARDVNGDGAIDQRDVDAVAMTAVRLDRGAAR